MISRPFEGLLGNNSELRMLEFLLPLEGIDFNITELAKEVGVVRQTVAKVVKKFVEWGVLNSKARAGVTYYSINPESPIVKNIEQFNDILIENILGDEALYEIHDYWETQRPHAMVRTARGNMHFDQILLQQSVQPYSLAFDPTAAIGLENIWGQLPQRDEIPQAPVATSTMNMRSLTNFGGQI
jgi:predicted DNA-binding transcriptional regulator